MEFVTFSDILRRAFELLLIVSTPFLLVSLFVGLIISFLQTLTNIQEATLAFVPKIISVFILAAILAAFISSQFNDFMKELFLAIPAIVR